MHAEPAGRKTIVTAGVGGIWVITANDDSRCAKPQRAEAMLIELGDGSTAAEIEQDECRERSANNEGCRRRGTQTDFNDQQAGISRLNAVIERMIASQP